MRVVRVWLDVSSDRYQGEDVDAWLMCADRVGARFGPRARAWYLTSSFVFGWWAGSVRHLFRSPRSVRWSWFVPDMQVCRDWVDTSDWCH